MVEMSDTAAAVGASATPGTPTRTAEHLDTDYLIIGAGAMGMAFADVILAEDSAARIVMVDRHANPGGHWNDAYPYVRLHQPAAFYGLNSTTLGRGGADLTSCTEILAYFKTAMDRFIRTGRVRFLSMSEYRSDGRIVSTVDPDRVCTVTAHRRIVDGTYMKVEVPSICPPSYPVDADVALVPPNGLAGVREPYQRYVIIGAGKTGMDAILFLLDQGVAADRIQWIVSNDAWLLDRGTMQPGLVMDTVVAMLASIADATEVDQAFLRLEREGIVARLNPDVLPPKWRCATVDRRELANLRRITDVVRMGRVQRVGSRAVVLDRGTIDVVEGTLFVDCSANGLAKIPPVPLFAPGRVTLQSVFMCQQTFSAALIAHLELQNHSDEQRNRICTAVPHPELKADLASTMVTTAQNMLNCSRHMPLWLRNSRLYLGHHAPAHRYLLNSGRLAVMQRRLVRAAARMGPAPSKPVG